MSAKKIPQSTARKQREQQNTLQANRSVLYVALAIAVELLLVFLDRCITSVRLLPVFRSVTMAMVIGFSLALLLSLYRFSSLRGADAAEKVMQPEVQVLLSAVGLLAGLFIRTFYSDGIKLFYIVVPGLYVLHLIRLIYGNAFCCVASFILGSGSLLYILNRLLQMGLFSGMQPVFGILLAASGTLYYLFCIRLNKRGGVLLWRGEKRQFFRVDDSYLPGYLAGLVIVFLGGVFLWAAAYALFYGVIALSALLVLIGLYYTYTLMYR